MTFGLLPVKSPEHAMQRLSGVLSQQERARLARILFSEALAKLLAVPRLGRVAVASSDREVLEEAERAGALTLPEEQQSSHSDSADRAARECMALGASTLMLVPIDVPLATPEELLSLLEAARRQQDSAAKPGLVIVPSEDGTGTNAMVRTPPDLIRSHFGPGSFAAHTAEAKRKGAAIAVERPLGIVFDIDTPEDLVAYGRRGHSGPVWEYLLGIGAAERAAAHLAGGRTAAPQTGVIR